MRAGNIVRAWRAILFGGRPLKLTVRVRNVHAQRFGSSQVRLSAKRPGSTGPGIAGEGPRQRSTDAFFLVHLRAALRCTDRRSGGHSGDWSGLPAAQARSPALVELSFIWLGDGYVSRVLLPCCGP